MAAFLQKIMKKYFLYTSAFFAIVALLFPACSSLLIYAYGFNQNVEFAKIIENKISSKYANNTCSIIAPAHEKYCSVFTRGRFCVAVQVPKQCAEDNEYKETLFRTIKESLSGKIIYVNVLFQNVKSIKVITSRRNGVVGSYSFPKVDRSLFLRVWRYSTKYSNLGTAAKECAAYNKEWCEFDEDKDLAK